jgi:hypothetical protein
MRFEDAAVLRDRLLSLGAPIDYEPEEAPVKGRRRGKKKKASRPRRS